MKSLALSLACAVGFATPGLCGDLGRADISTHNDLAIESSFSANCYGSLDKPQGPECSIDFINGKMSVDGSSGITSNQVKSVAQNYHPDGYFVNVEYATTEGKSSLAQFSFLKKTVAKQFLNTLVLFISDDLEVPTQEPAADIVEEIKPEVQYETESSNENIEYGECTGPSILCF
mgnify:CR=1 FL=1